MTDKTILTSPKGKFLFVNVKNARKNAYTGNSEFAVRLEVFGSEKDSEDFKKQLKRINKSLLVTEDKEGNSIVSDENNYIINGRSQNRPKVFDKDMNVIDEEELPMIDSGIGRVLLTTFESKNGKGGGINLVGVQLLDYTEYQGSAPVDEDELLNALKKHHS
jgi:hypothetical protein